MSLLYWGFIALIVSIVAAALGFGGVASGAASIAKLLFGLFLVIALVIFVLVVLGVGAVAGDLSGVSVILTSSTV